jgi:Family of unknown function (DUF6159)
VSDVSQGPGWWIASDGRWYPPELHPVTTTAPSERMGDESPRPEELVGQDGHRQEAADDLARWVPVVATPMDAPPVRAYPTASPSLDTSGYAAGGVDLPPMAMPPPGDRPVPGDASSNAYQQFTPASSGGRFSRGLRLVGIGFTMARDEPGLMAVPIVAFVIQLLILGAGTLLLLPGLRADSTSSNGGRVHLTPTQWLVTVVAGVLVMFVSVVSHATIIARVMARFHGQQISNGKAARAALTKSPHLLAWAFINYVVVTLLRNISNRGIFGLLVGWILRAAWFFASFFVVPVILFEDRGAVSAIKRSAELCRQRWGENVIGNSVLGIIGFVAVLADMVVAVALGAVFPPLGVAVGIIGLIVILLVLTVASAAFNAALYWYAMTDQAPGQYSVVDLQSAYRQRGRKTGLYGV